MLRRILLAFLYSIVGYLVGAFGGGWLVSVLSHASDASIEGPMTGAFVTGPALAFLTFIVTLLIERPARPEQPRPGHSRSPE
jgi:hypothetical protein